MDPARNLQRRRTTSQLEFSSIPEEIIARPLQRMSSQPGSTSTPKPAVKQTSTLTCYRDDLQLTLDTSPFEPPSQHTPITPSVSIADSAFHEDGLDLDDELPTSFLSDDQSDLSDSDSGFSGSGNRDSSSASDNWDLRRRSTSMVEAKDQTYRKLREELMRAQKELQLKDQECGKLERVREQMEQELEELTASLFEEANKMVQDANVKRMHTEKLLNEAQSSIDVLNAEVSALKALVLTSTPSEPNRHLHPQIDRKSKEAPAESGIAKKLSFKKTHKRSTSHHITKSSADFEFDPTTPAPGPPAVTKITDSESFDCFVSWRENPVLSHDSPFISRLLTEDIIPCVSFANKQMSEQLVVKCENNNILIEPLPSSSQAKRLQPSVNCTLTSATSGRVY
ncbi:RAB3IL1 [Bugula neritina]|uniref:RAB3IL1 n=1 Tax=Bugula neritina TaxID=10212 RepID=A0A7J7K759_BUGNE|nr:RAB3IL1 [Bugula neritina]